MATEAETAAAAASQVQDVPQQLDYDLGMAVERLDSWIDGAIRLLPNIALALVVLVIAFFAGRLLRRLIQRRSAGRSRKTSARCWAASSIGWCSLLGFLLAATIVIPSLKPGDLIAGLGVSSVAIGFAFKDILQNWLAGLLILLRQPFEIGDQIEVNGHEGTVERIETRATIIKTYDGQRIVVPNSDIYTNAVLVKTAHEKRRSQYDVGIGYGDGIDEACEVIREAVRRCRRRRARSGARGAAVGSGGQLGHDPRALVDRSRRADVVHVHAAVIKAIKLALDEARIDMPYETQVQLFHDQTEAGDGDRGAQREGWPATEGGSTQPRWQAQAERQAAQG